MFLGALIRDSEMRLPVILVLLLFTPAQGYLAGTYFLGNASSYTAPHTYFFYVMDGDKEMYNIKFNKCQETRDLTTKMKSIYQNCGAHDIQWYDGEGGELPANFEGYIIMPIPNQASLVVFVNEASQTLIGNDRRPSSILECIEANSYENIINCLSTYDQQMLNCINTETDIKLPHQSCLKEWAIIVISIVGVIVGLPLLSYICIGLFMLCGIMTKWKFCERDEEEIHIPIVSRPVSYSATATSQTWTPRPYVPSPAPPPPPTPRRIVTDGYFIPGPNGQMYFAGSVMSLNG